MDIAETIRMIANKDRLPFGSVCKVLSVDAGAATCVCEPIDDSADIEDVRLQPSPASGILTIPVVGSMVIVQMRNDVEGFVAMFSEVDSIRFRDGSFGGITKTQELKTQLDKTNQVLQAIANTLTTWTVAANDGGAALKAAAIAALAGKVVGDYSGIENGNITHG
jgi:hypothetical protein